MCGCGWRRVGAARRSLVAREAIEQQLPEQTDGTLSSSPSATARLEMPLSGSISWSRERAQTSGWAPVVLIVDAGPLYAAAARKDKHHERAVALLSSSPRPLLVPALVGDGFLSTRRPDRRSRRA